MESQKKYNVNAIIAWIVAAICFCFAIANGIRASSYEERVHDLGQTETITSSETGETEDIVYVNFGASVYEDVNSVQPMGTFYSQLTEEEFLNFLDENGIVIGIPFDAQSAPSAEYPMYRISDNCWVQIIQPEDTTQ